MRTSTSKIGFGVFTTSTETFESVTSIEMTQMSIESVTVLSENEDSSVRSTSASIYFVFTALEHILTIERLLKMILRVFINVVVFTVVIRMTYTTRRHKKQKKEGKTTMSDLET